jgi:hypothetical protein
MTNPPNPSGRRSPLPWPQRGVPGGWRDVWEHEDDVVAAIARAQRFADETAQVRAAWRMQVKPTIPRRPCAAAEPTAGRMGRCGMDRS